MPWLIECDRPDSDCKSTNVYNIEGLLHGDHRRGDGRFKCSSCGGTGHIKRQYASRGKGETEPWRPDLIGAIQPDWCIEDPDGPYQPFLFITRERRSKAIGVWCRYYKHLEGGNIKFGDGPGGGPAFSPSELVEFSQKLEVMGFLDR